MVEVNLRHSRSKAYRPSRASKVSPAPGLLKSALGLQVSALAGVAVMLFFVAALSCATLVAHEEIASLVGGSAFSKFFAKAEANSGKVLGLASYGYQQPVCKNNVCLRYELVGLSNENWAANIFYYPQSGSNLRGSIKVNGQQFAYNISAGGSTGTGYNLEPGETYNFVFRSGLRGSGRTLNKLSITMPEEVATTCTPLPYVMPTSGCITDSCGNQVCAQSPVPSYGYQTVDVGVTPPNSWREGWIESAYNGNNVSPGSVKILGWAYDAGDYLSYPGRILVALRNINTGVLYQPVNTAVENSSRADLQSYLSRRLYGSSSFVSNVYTFVARFENLPAGSYVFDNAKYNNRLFNIHNNAQQPIVVSQQILPSYGYQSVDVGSIPQGSWREGWLESFSYDNYGNAPSNVKISGWVYNGDMQPSANRVAITNINTGVNYYVDNVSYQQYRPDVLSYLTNKLGRVPSFQNGSVFLTFKNIPAGVYRVSMAKYSNTDGPEYSFNISGDAQNTIYILPPISVIPTFKVTSPSSGEVLTPGQAYTIRWLTSSDASSVDIGIYKGNNCSSRTDSSVYVCGNLQNPFITVPNTGSYTWKVLNLVEAKDYYITVGILDSTRSNWKYANTTPFPFTISATQTQSPRVGKLINVNNTIYLVGYAQLYAFPNADVFNSWLYSYSDVVLPLASESSLSVSSTFVPMRVTGCSSPLDQIAGKCGVVKITGIQGYDPVSGAYVNNTVYSGKYMVLYGSFASSGNVVKMGGNVQNVTYQSATQINVLLGTLTDGSALVEVSNASGTSNSFSVNTAVSAEPRTLPPTVSLAPKITGLQGYNSSVYDNSRIVSGQYLIIYGSFGANGNTVTVNGVAQNVTYQSTTQINVLLGTLSGSTASVVVSNANGTSNTSTIGIVYQSATATPNPTPSPAPVVNGLQGYSVGGGYVTSITSGQYLILYGSFTASGNRVTVNGTEQTISYQSTTQINVLLGTLSGSTASVVVSNANGTSGIYSINIVNPQTSPSPSPTPLAPSPSPTPTPPSPSPSPTPTPTPATSVVVGSTVVAKSGAQGNWTEGTVNGSTVALLNGRIYNSLGQDITATFSSSDLAYILTKLATPSSTPAPSLVKIAGLQGYSSAGGYVTTVTSGQYLIVYGTFTATGNTVTVNGVSQTITYQSPTQINVLLGTLSGSTASVVVTNAQGSSDPVSIPVQ